MFRHLEQVNLTTGYKAAHSEILPGFILQTKCWTHITAGFARSTVNSRITHSTRGTTGPRGTGNAERTRLTLKRQRRQNSISLIERSANLTFPEQP